MLCLCGLAAALRLLYYSCVHLPLRPLPGPHLSLTPTSPSQPKHLLLICPPGRPAAAAAASGSAATATTWQAWEAVLPEWKSHKPEAAIAANADDRGKLAAAVGSAARTYKPPPTLGVPSLDDLGADVPRNLHERLALVARLQLQEYLQDASGAVARPTVAEFTTTDVTAALSVAGVIVTEKGKRTAIASLVACETERQMTWSRLEGLKFHWACASSPKGHWELPPRGWKTLPDTTGGQVWGSGGRRAQSFLQTPLLALLLLLFSSFTRTLTHTRTRALLLPHSQQSTPAARGRRRLRSTRCRSRAAARAPSRCSRCCCRCRSRGRSSAAASSSCCAAARRARTRRG